MDGNKVTAAEEQLHYLPLPVPTRLSRLRRRGRRIEQIDEPTIAKVACLGHYCEPSEWEGAGLAHRSLSEAQHGMVRR